MRSGRGVINEHYYVIVVQKRYYNNRVNEKFTLINYYAANSNCYIVPRTCMSERGGQLELIPTPSS